MLEARAGRLRPAAEALDIAVAIDPAREDIRLLDVRVLLGLRRLQDAARALDEGLKITPGSAALGAEWRNLTGRPYLR
jgi:predicted Zn-dependent protease